MRRRCFLRHPLEPLFQQATQSLTTALSDGSRRAYQATYRGFLRYLAADHPDVCRLDQLQRETHVIGWLTRMRSGAAPMAKITISIRVVCLHRMFDHLAWSQQLPALLRLLTRDDVPRREKKSPRPLTPEQDQLVQAELSKRNDPESTVLLLQRHTGMRIGECADLSSDCVHSIGADQWVLHVPLGKLDTERWIPVDAFVCDLVERLRNMKPDATSGDSGFLIGRARARDTIIRNIRATLRDVTAVAGITSRIVPHQFRHTFGTEMLRAGVSFPAVMRLLGHTDPKMTLQYLEITQPDLQREFLRARTHPRHLAPSPSEPYPPGSSHLDLSTVIDSIITAKRLIEMFRRDLLDRAAQRRLARIGNRLAKILAELHKLEPAE